MTNIFTVRPQEASDSTLAAGRELGLAIEAFPMWEIRPASWSAPDPATIDGLLIGSGNALLHAGEQLGLFADKPVHAVGARTAEIARAQGFAVASTGSGGLQQVIDALPPEPVRLLRLAAADRVRLSPPPHVTLVPRVAYRTEAQPMTAQFAGKLVAGPALVLLHSAAAARHFAAQCDEHGVPRSGIALAALGPRIADAAGAGWAAVASAPQPSEAALLALVRELG